MQHSLRRQRGLSFVSVVLIGFILVAAFAIGGQSVPIFTEYMAGQKAAQKAAGEASRGTPYSAPSRANSLAFLIKLDLCQGAQLRPRIL